MLVLVEPLTVPVRVTDCDTITVVAEGLTVTVTTLELRLPQPESASRASRPTLQHKIANLRNFFTTSTPKVLTRLPRGQPSFLSFYHRTTIRAVARAPRR